MDSVDYKQCWRWSDMIPSKSIRWLYLLSFLDCKKVRISFGIDEVTLRILWQINNYNFRFNFEILHSFLFSNASNTFRNTQFLSLESKITMNRLLTLVLRVKNMRRRISPIMKVIIWSFSKVNISTNKNEDMIRNRCHLDESTIFS